MIHRLIKHRRQWRLLWLACHRNLRMLGGSSRSCSFHPFSRRSMSKSQPLPPKEQTLFKRVLVSHLSIRLGSPGECSEGFRPRGLQGGELIEALLFQKCYEQKQFKNGLKFAKQILSNPKQSDHGGEWKDQQTDRVCRPRGSLTFNGSVRSVDRSAILMVVVVV